MHIIADCFRGSGWFTLAAGVLCLSVTWGQSPTGEIRIAVKDPSGAAMLVAGKLKGLATRADRNFHTDARGRYTLSDLPFGRYRLEISRTGFATQTEVIEVSSASPISRTYTLAVGPTATTVHVVETTPLPGINRLRNEIAGPVQTLNEADLEHSGALNLADFLNRRLDGVFLNEVQGNPFQPDVNYRGYTASPLLGTPQGLSVYMDGVRLNQPFGDVVSWDLIPRIAISETTLIPGSNPLFGLNTLGGALSIETKNGPSKPGTSLALSGGSYGGRMAELEHGGSSRNGFNWYGATSLLFDDGWREDSPSNVRQVFGKIGWQGSNTSLGLSIAYANNSLNGNGLQEFRFLSRDYSSVYTKPDITANRSPFLNLNVRHSFTDKLLFSGNVYYRYIRTNTFNGDINEDALDQSLYQPSAAERAALTAAGYTGFPTSGENATNTPFPFWRCIANALLRDEPVEKCNGLINRTRAQQHNYGLSGQVTWLGSPGANRNQFTVGGAWDGSRANFSQSTELGYLNPDRSVTGVGAFGDGVTGGDVDGEPFDTRVDLRGHPNTGSVFGTDTLSLGRWSFTVSGRHNRTSIDNLDRIRRAEGPGSLTGKHQFQRFNPAAGVTFSPIASFNAYFSYSEGSRAPTSIELGCADPDHPCKLPNVMAGDPPLKQVVTRTWEAGLRGGASESRFNWSVGWFFADNRDDILFVASRQTGFGYFKNFGKTRRQGIEVDLRARIWRIGLGGGYTFLDATYQSEETVNGESNSSNDEAAEGLKGLEGAIEIEPGNRIPFIPQHMLKVFADFQATSKLSFNLSMNAFSSSYGRGNENNQHAADGVYYLGPGKSGGYAAVNLGASYLVHKRVELFARINNLLDRQYFTAAQLGPTGFTDTGNFIARPFPAVSGEFPLRHSTFYAPGAPRIVWGGIRLRF